MSRAPLHQALVRQSLWWGCNPTALILVGGFCALVGIGGGVAFRAPLLGGIGALLFWAGRRGLVWMANRDPMHPWIYLRAWQYERVYVARSRWDVPSRPRRRWA